MRARTIPTLERERDLLRARLAQVRRPKKLADRVTLIAQMEKENMELYDQVQENVAAQERTDAKTAEMFAFFDEVRAITLCPSLAADLREMAGTATGRRADVDAFDCRDTKRYKPSFMMKMLCI